MKKSKLLPLLLATSMLFTGCSSPSVQETPPVDEPPSETKTVTAEVVENEKLKVEKDVTVFNDDKIISVLEDNGYTMKKSSGYTLYPSETHFYPEYLSIDGDFKTVYLDTETVQNKIEVFESYDNVMISSTVNSAPSGGVFGGLFNKTSSAVADSIDGFAVMESVSMAADAAPPMSFPVFNFNTSEYKDVKESGFLNVSTSPLSTFAADVDTASYSNFRGILRDRVSEEVIYEDESLHDIRIEEMLNYFDYDFNSEINEDFAVAAEISDTPWNSETQLLTINVKARDLAPEEATGSNLVFLVDTSGSMDNRNKLPLLKQSLKLLVNQLSDKDTISLVTYSGDERVILEGATGEDGEEIMDAIDELIPYGSTNGEGGLRKAYEIAEKYMDGHTNSRIIMCSDGDLNVGITSEDELFDFVSEKRETGIYLSVLGFGLGNYKDNKMETLADNGNGNYHYIDSIKEGRKVLVEDLMSTLVTLGDDVKFQLEFNPNYIKAYRKIGYENRNMADEDFHDDTKDGGEVGYGHEVTIVYEIVPVDSEMELADTNLKYQENTSVNSDITDWLTLSVRYKNHGEDVSNLLEFVIDENHYTDTPSSDWKFIADVVAFGLLVNDSEYIDNWNLDTIIESLDANDFNDENKIEFLGLVRAYNYYLENSED